MGKKKRHKKKKRSDKRKDYSAGGRKHTSSKRTTTEDSTLQARSAEDDGTASADALSKQAISDHSSRLIDRYLDTLEGQLRVKDEQIRTMDERLQDAFEMQRALALLVKTYERRTGLSAEAVWDAVSDSELAERDRTPDNSPDDSPGPVHEESAAVDSSPRQQEVPVSSERVVPKSEASNARGAFTYWLRKTT